MSDKKYPALYQHIQAYCALIAQYADVPDQMSYAQRRADAYYRTACKQLREGTHTEEQIIADFPLD